MKIDCEQKKELYSTVSNTYVYIIYKNRVTRIYVFYVIHNYTCNEHLYIHIYIYLYIHISVQIQIKSEQYCAKNIMMEMEATI